MATNLALDDRLIEEARAIGGHRTKKDAVTAALTEYIQRRKQMRVVKLFGTIDYYRRLPRQGGTSAKARMMVLADTSIWSVALRRTHQDLASIQKQQARILQELISEGRVQLWAVVRQELLSGIRRPEQFARLREHLRSFSDVSLDREDYERAAEMNNTCRAMGLIGGVIDLIRRCCTQELGHLHCRSRLRTL